MKAIHKKLMVGGLLLAAGVGYLAFASVQGGWVYYMPVADFVQQTKFHSQRVKLSGKVLADGFSSSPASLTASFKMAGSEGKTLPVIYKGVIPDLFAAEREVVVEGRLDSAGVFQADQLLTKCASKYEAQDKDPTKSHPGEIQRSGA